MWTTLACVAALSLTPAQAGKLTLTNVTTTQGLLGPSRPDANVVPGDIFYVAFDIQNISVAGDGTVEYNMAMQVLDKGGKAQFKQDPKPLKAVNSLGGNSLPAFAHVHVGLDQPAGTYTVEVTVTDLGSKAATKPTATLRRQFTVVPLKFSLVRLQVTYAEAEAPESKAAPPIGMAGQTLWINFAAVGFKRDAKTNDPSLKVTMVIKDEKGKPVLTQPFTGEASGDIPKNYVVVPMQFWMSLNRAGKFTVDLVGEDRIGKTQATLSFPLTVLPR
jgi:hypothetical protein